MPDVSLAAMPQRRPFAHFPLHLALIVLAISAIGIFNLASASRSAPAQVWGQQTAWMGVGLVLALVKGRYVMGARRWIGFGPVNFQPSELAKLSVAFALASWFNADAEKRKDGYGLLGIVIPLGITLVPAVLTLKQPDLGTALIICAVGFTQILFARVRWKAIAI